MTAPLIVRLRVALVEAPLETPIVVPFGTVSVRRTILVRVETDDGGWGIGESWGNFPPWGCRERVDILRNAIRPLLVGQPLDNPSRLYRLVAERLRTLANQLGAVGPFQQALAGADIALWDAAARRAGQPLAQFIRGAPAGDRVDVYATNLTLARPAVIEQMAGKGHTRFKFRIRGGDPSNLDRLREARSIAGPQPLMADATQSFDLGTLRPLAEQLAALDLGWLEEPFPVDDFDSYRSWRDEPVRPPVAMGENSYRESGFQQLLDDIAPEILQPDITKTGGISEGRLICRRILDAGRRACLHMYGGPIGLYASAHLAAALDGVSWLEMDSLPNPLCDRLLLNGPGVESGQLLLPQGAGLGDDLIAWEAFDAAEIN
jgi:L-alanine-DL-glutamate epimerase-like enolase superfamily enzyme